MRVISRGRGLSGEVGVAGRLDGYIGASQTHASMRTGQNSVLADNMWIRADFPKVANREG